MAEIRLYCGLMRNGKGLHQTRDVVFKNLIYGRRVISNTPIWYTMPDGHTVYAEHYEDYERFKYEIMHSRGSLCVVDEMSLFFSSSKWQNLELEFQQKFRQGAKQGNDLYGTTQSFSDVLANLRRVISDFYFCKKSYWLWPWPLDLTWKKYNKKTGFYDRKGKILHTPIVYDCWHVDGAYFTSKALLAENRQRFIYSRSRMYPSEFRRVAVCYKHDYEIKSTAILSRKGGGKIIDYSQYKDWEDYREQVLFQKDGKSLTEQKLSTNNPQTISPSYSPNT